MCTVCDARPAVSSVISFFTLIFRGDPRPCHLSVLWDLSVIGCMRGRKERGQTKKVIFQLFLFSHSRSRRSDDDKKGGGAGRKVSEPSGLYSKRKSRIKSHAKKRSESSSLFRAGIFFFCGITHSQYTCLNIFCRCAKLHILILLHFEHPIKIQLLRTQIRSKKERKRMKSS